MLFIWANCVKCVYSDPVLPLETVLAMKNGYFAKIPIMTGVLHWLNISNLKLHSSLNAIVLLSLGNQLWGLLIGYFLHRIANRVLQIWNVQL